MSVDPIIDHAPCCWRCGRTLAEMLARPWQLKCRRCKAPNKAEVPTNVRPHTDTPASSR